MLGASRRSFATPFKNTLGVSMMRISGFIGLMAVIAALGGCAKDQYFLKSADISSASLVTDAKQRAILTFPATDQREGAKVATRRIVCAEPSPDVAQALSSALQAGLTLDLGKVIGANTANKALGFDFGQSSSASVAQLGERLAVVQLLRDKMYRACEAYANGAIGEAAYTLLLARNDKSMMSLLSNEMAAGAFGRSLATLGGQASAANTGVDAKALAEQQARVKSAAAALKTAATADTPKKADIDAAAAKLEEETNALVALERRINATASSSAQAGGSISGSKGDGGPAHVAAIHQAFLDDDGVDPLIDACIIGVERLAKDDPAAKQYLNNIAERYSQSRVRIAQIGEEIDRLNRESLRIEGDVMNAQAALARPPSANDREPGMTAADIIRGKVEVEALARRIDSLKLEREEAAKTPAVVAEDLYLASGSPFAAFCFRTVLGGDSKFMNLRMRQKRLLRGIEPSDDAMTMKKLEVCVLALRDEKAFADPKDRAAFAASCKRAIDEK